MAQVVAEEQNGTDVPLDANGRPKKPEANWARWGRGEDYTRNVYLPTSPTDAGLLTPVPRWPLPPHWLEDNDHEHLVPKEVPKPPAHLVEGTGTAPRFPAKPKLPNHRALSRVSDGFLLPYTHPLTKNEVLVVHRSTRIQTAIKKFGMGVKGVLEAMDLICHQAYEMVHVGGDAMAYWTDNIKAEVEDRSMAPADTVSGLVAQWLLFSSTDALFAGLVCSAHGNYKNNAVLDPVAHHLYRAERKQQEAANAKVQKKIDAWEAKYGEARQTHAKRCDEWRKYAAEKGAAVAYRDYAIKVHSRGDMPTYHFETAKKVLDEQESSADFSAIMYSSLQGTLQKFRALMADDNAVAVELKRYHDKCNSEPPFTVSMLLSNARSAGRSFRARLEKEVTATQALRDLTEVWHKAVVAHSEAVVAERTELQNVVKEINEAGESDMRHTLETARDYGYSCTDRALEKWTDAAWTKPFRERFLNKALAVEDELTRRDAKFGSAFSIFKRLTWDLQDLAKAHDLRFKTCPNEDGEFSRHDSGEEDDVVFTKVVTREERDAKGRAEAEVLE